MIRLFSHSLPLRVMLLSVAEALVVYAAVALGLGLVRQDFGAAPASMEAAAFALAMIVSMGAFGLYQGRSEPFGATARRLLLAYGSAALASCALLAAHGLPDLRSGAFALASAAAVAGIVLLRLAFLGMSSVGLPKRRVLVLGNGREAEDVIRLLHSDETSRAVEYAGLYPVTQERDTPEGPRVVSHEHLLRAVRALDVSEIVVAVRERRGGVLPLRQLLDARLMGVRVLDLDSFYERELGLLRVDSLRASWLLFGTGFGHGIGRDVVKRLFDLVIGLTGLVATLPLLLVSALAIALESGRPVVCRQQRIGAGGRPFVMYALRSTRGKPRRRGAEHSARPDDGRTTRVGRIIRRTHIDRIPGLVNVLRGDMSLVGPSAEQPSRVERLRAEIPYYDVRHSLKPGLTGWSQVRHPRRGSPGDARRRLEFDLYYVKNHSLFLDLLILVETIQMLVLGKGAR